MRRFAGVKGNRFYAISNVPLNGKECIEVPEELNNLSSEEIIAYYRLRAGKFVSKRKHVPAKDLKVALVGNWKMRCGISSYSENLWPLIAAKVGDVKLFIEKNDKPTGELNVLGSIHVPEEKVVACWKRGEPLSQLASEINAYDPDIVFIQHEFGIWPNAGYWLSLMSQLSTARVIVTLHSVFHHRDKTIVEAAIPEIVVHLQGAKKVLKEEKGVPGEVTVIPHGCYECVSKEKLWNFYKSPFTFLQFGFGFRYKGWQESIRACAILKKKFPNVFFTGIFSESQFNQHEHQIYFDELNVLIDELDLKDNVAIIRGFQSDESLDSYIRTNQVTVFPYVSSVEHEVFGASGAARLAMSKYVPVITSEVNHFADLPTIKANTAEEIADKLELMFTNAAAKKEQVETQLKFVEENSWEKICEKYIALFEKNE